uniref:6-phosphogluconolactonase n=1 Tax=Alexandrium monilatum TaxID=311494 RepID=A0A7S4SJ17_9DINO
MVGRSVLSILAYAGVAANERWWVGSGGCDGAMTGCVGDKESEQALRQIEVQPDGRMTPVGSPVPTGGLPAWLTVADGCLFAALADADKILSISANSVQGAARTGGTTPVHLTATNDGKFLLVADYNGPDDANSSRGAGAASLAISAPCRLEQRDFVPHDGSGPDRSRQGAAHVHSIYASRDGQLAYSCDLGQDLIFTYSVGADGKLTEVSRARAPPGSGPRHLAEHPSLDFVYSVQEMGQSVAAWRKHANGSLELAQILSLVPEGSSSKGSKAGEIVIAPDGRALYATNRGRLNTVTVFSVVEGSIAQVQQIDAPRFPRGMELAHGGTLLLVASQEDTTVESFRVAADGTLSPTGHVLKEGLPDHPATLAKFGPVAAPLAMET